MEKIINKFYMRGCVISKIFNAEAQRTQRKSVEFTDFSASSASLRLIFSLFLHVPLTIIIFTILITFSCGDDVIQKAQNFIPNKPPNIISFTSDSPGGATLLPNQSFNVTVKAEDPNENEMRFDYTSDLGSFASQNDSGGSSTVKYILPGELYSGFEAVVTVTVTDIKGASTTQSLNLGSGKTGPQVSMPEGTAVGEFINNNSYTTVSFEADSNGFYQYYYSLVTGIDPAQYPECNVNSALGNPFYFYENETTVVIDIFGTSYVGIGSNAESPPIVLPPDDGTYQICIGVRDALNQDSFLGGITGLVVTLDNIQPVTSVSSPGGTYNTVQNISLTCTDDVSGCEKTIYTLDGSVPEFNGDGTILNGTEYSSPISVIDGGTTLNYISRDIAGNVEALKTQQYTIDTINPYILSATSTTPNGIYGEGANISISMTFNEPVTLTGGSLVVTLDTGADVSVSADSYPSDVFTGTYTVGAGENSSDLAAASILLLAGSLLDINGNSAVLSVPSQNISLSSDIVIDTDTPGIINVTSSTANGYYNNTSGLILIDVVFNKDISLDTAGGSPFLELNSGVLVSAVNPVVTGTNTGSDTLQFSYTIGAGENSLDLDYVDSFSLILNGGTIKTTDLTKDAILTLPVVGAAGSLSFNKDIVVDTIAPVITSITSTTADGTYSLGDSINVTVTMSEPVSLSGGNLNITLDTGTLVSVSAGSYPSDVLTGTYTVSSGENSANLDSTFAALSAGTLQDPAGNDANLSTPAVTIASGSSIIIDTIIPFISNVTSSTADGSYNEGAIILIDILFSGDIDITGSPILILNSSGIAYYTGYTTAGVFNEITFEYTVGAWQNNLDLDYTAPSALLLSGGTIKKAGTILNADINLPFPTEANSLSFNKNIAIDTAAPFLSFVSISSSNANSTLAKTGDVIEIDFSSNESITPVVTIAGASAVISGTGPYTASHTLTGSEAEGLISFSIDFADTAGNPGSLTTSVTDASSVTYDKIPPNAPAALGLASADDTGILNTDNITKNTTGLTISGTSEANMTISLISDIDGSLGSTASDGAGNWSLDISLTENVHSITATATDTAGNVSTASTPLVITVDITSPVTTILPNAGDYMSVQNITLTCADNSAGCGSTIYTNDTSTPAFNADGTISVGIAYTPFQITNGSYTIKYISFDFAGNAESENTSVYYISVCGDGITQSLYETCDDGDTIDNGNGCDAFCFTNDVCGDGITQSLYETCDDGNTIDDGNGCSAACQTNDVCGDGSIQSLYETCDDGNAIDDGNGCDAVCQTNDVCGDGVVQSLYETCDDGNAIDDGNGCDASCMTNNVCGDGSVQSLYETCDDGNAIDDGNGCDTSCQRNDVCGDGIIQSLYETCDNGGESASCDDDCTAVSCGDSNINELAGEYCDDGNTIDDGNGCSATCLLTDGEVCVANVQCLNLCDLAANGSNKCEPLNTCGNGTVEAGEYCDDGNTLDDANGCSTGCIFTDGQACSSSIQCVNVCDLAVNGSNQCEAINTCGNGVVEAGETCDDGNTIDDGNECDEFCKIKEGNAGYQKTENIGVVSFNMRLVPSKSFKIDSDYDGSNGVDDLRLASVSINYFLAETEVTYELWYEVYTWAVGNGYTFANPGREGNLGAAGALPTAKAQEPVTTINWRDAMVWMNALTEYYNAQNGTSLEPVYYSDSSFAIPIKDSSDGAYFASVNPNPGGFDNPYVKEKATGFRLPSNNEWELAVKYIEDANNDGDILDAGEYYPGNHVSGDNTAPYDTSTVLGNYSWHSGNSSVTHNVATKTANALGLFDMSGNVWEWVLDWHPLFAGSFRLSKAGSFTSMTNFLQIGLMNSSTPYYEVFDLGFRIAQTEPPKARDRSVYNTSSTNINMRYVPPKSFKIDSDFDPTNGVDDLGFASVNQTYHIAETEVTYELWYEVYTWATTDAGGGLRADGGTLYTFANAGREGHDGTIGAGPTTAKLEPVTMINWRDVMVFTNALTEYYNAINGTSLECVYTSDAAFTTCIRNSSDGAYSASVNPNPGSFDNPYVNIYSDGFRMLTNNEWELAARYIEDANNDGDILDAGEYYPGNYASGATADYTDAAATDIVAWYDANSGASTHPVGQKMANALGLYDMSGNIWEYSFNWHPSFIGNNRIAHSGGFDNISDYLQIGIGDNKFPYNESLSLGLRLAKGKQVNNDNRKAHNVNGVIFNMRQVPSKSFFTGVDDNGDIDGDLIQDISPVASVEQNYRIAETEVTYELWYEVYQWAITNGYTFANAGTEGNDGTAGALPTAAAQEPVTMINWRDAMVWMNALTEYYNAQNGTALDIVYYSDGDNSYATPHRDSTDSTCGAAVDITAGACDNPDVKEAATGFRLPSSNEWELAARYIDDINNDGDVMDAGEYYPGNHISGDTTNPYDTSSESGNYGWYVVNSSSVTHNVATKTANTLGLYDMSGNVWEGTLEWYPGFEGSFRVGRGGSWNYSAFYMQVGSVVSFNPYDEVSDFGFRIAQNEPPKVGDRSAHNVGSTLFKMRYVEGKTFPTGTDDSGTATVTEDYLMAETEVTYELWYKVYTWATDPAIDRDGDGFTNASHGDDDLYIFANTGIPGHDGTAGTETISQEPVTTINWRDAMIFSNALTEYYNVMNGTSFDCVYTADAGYAACLRISTNNTSSSYGTLGTEDDPYVNLNAKGFRLPANDEWELAARYINDANSDGDILDTGEYYPGNYASGATAAYNNSAATGEVAWYDANSGSVTHNVGMKTANVLGMYDVSGNLWEWIYDWNTVGTNRVLRGGSYFYQASYLQVGFVSFLDPYYGIDNIGFRLARNP